MDDLLKDIFVLFLERTVLFLEEQYSSGKKGVGLCRCFNLFLNQSADVQHVLKLRMLEHLHNFDTERPGIILDGISNNIRDFQQIRSGKVSPLRFYQLNWFNRFDSGELHRIEFVKWMLEKEKS